MLLGQHGGQADEDGHHQGIDPETFGDFRLFPHAQIAVGADETVVGGEQVERHGAAVRLVDSSQQLMEEAGSCGDRHEVLLDPVHIGGHEYEKQESDEVGQGKPHDVIDKIPSLRQRNRHGSAYPEEIGEKIDHSKHRNYREQVVNGVDLPLESIGDGSQNTAEPGAQPVESVLESKVEKPDGPAPPRYGLDLVNEAFHTSHLNTVLPPCRTDPARQPILSASVNIIIAQNGGNDNFSGIWRFFPERVSGGEYAARGRKGGISPQGGINFSSLHQ